ncbi:LytR/AlgR family response regulator transcription factor [Rhodoferax aquaticus]|uniref:Response regulator transcription factor n=1 Tax=Rhodoferax aquaticus TaxID=2527691 RepID=A0A515EQT5_9BURK|nr:LytTR family DNA-binding domain-containing protein [Rhodoferax aquaticus]QDL55019.1 response regulator transcription factor [Rhodoferax aquaticus]
MSPCALIAEDEPLLAAALQADLSRVWPELRVLGIAGDGVSAVEQALTLRPDILFFDIRMPGQTGLDAAIELADLWDSHAPQGKPFPQLVFVTAYDQYAVQAFDAQAVDYLLKPVQADRLLKTVQKLQLALVKPAQEAINFEATIHQLRHLMGAGLGSPSAAGAPATATPTLTVIQASVGTSIRMVPIAEVVYFEAADKYVRVLTASQEYLIRTPLKELLPQLDSQAFWQIHRGTVVNASQIDAVHRDEAGKLHLRLRTRTEKLTVSRLYAHLFKAM